MIQRLRKNFILSAMLSLFIVMVILIGAAGATGYLSAVREADDTLETLCQNQGRFPFWMMQEGQRGNGRFSPELAFETRYFSVAFDSDGKARIVDLENIAAIDMDGAVEMARQVLTGTKTSGFVGSYRYAVTSMGTYTRVVFLDCTRSLGSVKTFLRNSALVGAVVFLAFFGLTLLFSGRFIRPLAESYQKQKQFITDAGHEIKTPITIIDADAELLEMDLPDSEWVQDIRAQTRRLAGLTNDLIYLSRMDEERLEVQRIEFPFSDLVAETAQSFRARAVTEKKNFTVDVEPMITFCGEEKSLRQLVSLLTDNALKYSPEGGTISVELKKNRNSIVLTVRNSCDAIPEGDLNELFDRFYRADRSRSSATGGHGLGLSIARAIVTAHKGKITAASEGGDTMVFTAVFPEKA